MNGPRPTCFEPSCPLPSQLPATHKNDQSLLNAVVDLIQDHRVALALSLSVSLSLSVCFSLSLCCGSRRKRQGSIEFSMLSAGAHLKVRPRHRTTTPPLHTATHTHTHHLTTHPHIYTPTHPHTHTRLSFWPPLASRPATAVRGAATRGKSGESASVPYCSQPHCKERQAFPCLKQCRTARSRNV